jgi:hypothetical protein
MFSLVLMPVLPLQGVGLVDRRRHSQLDAHTAESRTEKPLPSVATSCRRRRLAWTTVSWRLARKREKLQFVPYLEMLKEGGVVIQGERRGETEPVKRQYVTPRWQELKPSSVLSRAACSACYPTRSTTCHY